MNPGPNFANDSSEIGIPRYILPTILTIIIVDTQWLKGVTTHQKSNGMGDNRGIEKTAIAEDLSEGWNHFHGGSRACWTC
jgi:hypothetical protein